MSKKYTIAVIDDTVSNLKYLHNLLTAHGYIVKASSEPDFAIESFKLEKPDLILLDIKMPHKDGFEVCKMLKSDDVLNNIPIIFISALDDIQNKLRAFAEGGADYITKPFESEEILARVRTQLQLFESKESINKLLEYQDLFLKKIIHDMNTPLSIIFLNMDSLKQIMGDFEQFSAIKAASKTLSCIYNDLYYLTKKEARMQNIEKIPLLQFIIGRKKFFYEMLSVKNLSIEIIVDDEFEIHMDKYELERVLDNTISNAIKYSYENSNIIIKLSKADKSNILSIKNYGPTIVNKENTFKPFCQQKSTNIGLGLGLSIIKEICDSNMIQIKLFSENAMTCFEYIFNKKP